MVDWILLRAVGVLFREIEPASQKQSIIDFPFLVCQSVILIQSIFGRYEGPGQKYGDYRAYTL
jgi:hypothetical protein